MTCHGNSDHCCWVDGAPCPHLEEGTVPGRRWACGLFRKLGDWGTVHESEDYLRDVRPHWDRAGVIDCGDWTGANARGDGGPQCCFAETEVVING